MGYLVLSTPSNNHREPSAQIRVPRLKDRSFLAQAPGLSALSELRGHGMTRTVSFGFHQEY